MCIRDRALGVGVSIASVVEVLAAAVLTMAMATVVVSVRDA